MASFPFYRRFRPNALIILWSILVTLLVTEAFVGIILAFTSGAWLTLSIFAPKPIEERINENLDDFKIVRDSAEAKSESFQAPKKWLADATHYWMYATGLVLIELLLIGVVSPVQFSNTFDLPLVATVPIIAYAFLRTYHVVEFNRDRFYYPKLEFSDYLERGGTLAGILLIDVFYAFMLSGLFSVDTIP